MRHGESLFKVNGEIRMIELLRRIGDAIAKQTQREFPMDKVVALFDTTEIEVEAGYAIAAVEDAVFERLDAVVEDMSVDFTLLAGSILYIPIKGKVKLTSGKVFIYKR